MIEIGVQYRGDGRALSAGSFITTRIALDRNELTCAKLITCRGVLKKICPCLVTQLFIKWRGMSKYRCLYLLVLHSVMMLLILFTPVTGRNNCIWLVIECRPKPWELIIGRVSAMEHLQSRGFFFSHKHTQIHTHGVHLQSSLLEHRDLCNYSV